MRLRFFPLDISKYSLYLSTAIYTILLVYSFRHALDNFKKSISVVVAVDITACLQPAKWVILGCREATTYHPIK